MSLNKLKSIQNGIDYHQNELKHLNEEKKIVAGQLISSLINQMKELDETVPQWRQHCSGTLNELKEVLNHAFSKGSDSE